MNNLHSIENKLGSSEFEESLRNTLTVDRIDHQNLSIATNFGIVSISGSGNMSISELHTLLVTNPHVNIEKTTIFCPYNHNFVISTEQKRRA